MISWDAVREMEELRREMERAFEGFATGRRPVSRRTAFLPGYSARQYPLVNLSEDKDNLYVEALAPGVNPESIDLTVQGTTLTISGEKKPSSDLPAEEFHRCERSAGRFVRTVDLPSAIDDAGVKANYKNGLLVITLPKHETAKPKQIAVQVG